MKYLALICSCLLILLFIGCEQNQPTSPERTDKQSGNLTLKIDRVNAPEGVVWVEAFLTRQGYDTISSTMNILSDSTADLLLEEIQAGEWHLQVDAKDSLGVVLYTGNTDVEILAGFTTQVYLVLEPTGEGTGNIYIWVTWGITNSGNWTDYDGNPILVNSGNYWDYSGVSQPKVLIENGVFEMFYTAQGSAYSGYIGRAYSNDGINWTTYNNPVLSPGLPGSWDETAVSAATVIKETDGYKMYYHGWSDPWSPWHIGLATSVDGNNWTKYPNPVIYASGGQEYQLAPSSIIKIEDTYYLYYSGRSLPYADIRLATSPDGINWTKYSGNPILTYDKTWEGTAVYYPTVYQNNNEYVMVFVNQSGTGFGKATSTDGINWIKDESNPFFTKYDTHNNWGVGKIAYPNLVRVNSQDRIYYSGYAYEPPFSIGFVSK